MAEMRSLQELRALQALDLETKVMLTKDRIRQWVQEYGEDGVYISFSGGKDSTVLLHLVRELYPNVTAVFIDTGLEYPQIREFVKMFDNVEWVKPKKNFKQVIIEYGYPFISKEISDAIELYRNWERSGKEEKTQRVKRLLGEGEYEHSRYNSSRWHFLTKAPFKLSAKCCAVMKKSPVHTYERKTGKKGMTGQQATESLQRETQWRKNGCNGFNMKHPISNPLAFWTEQDILQYIKQNNIPIASVYGDIIEEWDGIEAEGQISFGIDKVKLKCTGLKRTGCMFCGYGCHLDKAPSRFERMKETNPTIYNYIMKPLEEGGLGYKDVIEWINANNPSKRKIRY